MAITVIHGPQRTGKTLNAERFRQHYGCSRVLDRHSDEMLLGDIRDGDLLLTTSTPDELARILRHARFRAIAEQMHDARHIPVNEARAAIGLEPAPASGFMAEPCDRTERLTAARTLDAAATASLTHTAERTSFELEQMIRRVRQYAGTETDVLLLWTARNCVLDFKERIEARQAGDLAITGPY
jgi:hypothetical protein